MNRDDGVDGGGRAGENGGYHGVIFFATASFLWISALATVVTPVAFARR